MPGAVARTSAFALNNATLPFALKIANLGAEEAMRQDPHLANGLNVSDGKIRHEAVAEALDLAVRPGYGVTGPAGGVLNAATPCSTNCRHLASGGALARILAPQLQRAFAIARSSERQSVEEGRGRMARSRRFRALVCKLGGRGDSVPA